MKEGKSVCVDNTNPSKKARADFIALARKHKVASVRCFKMTTPLELCHHLNYVRQNYSLGKNRRVPDVGYNMFKSQYEEPQMSEGFTDIIQIDFTPHFHDERHETVFKQFTN